MSTRPGRPGALPRRSHRRHAAKVALVTTGVVAVLALVIGVALDTIVLHRLQAGADSRLADRLQAIVSAGPLDPTSPDPLAHTADGDGDYDDAPALVWLVAPDGRSRALVSDAPALPVRRWHSGSTVTLPLGGQRFRVAAASFGGGWVVVAESTGQIQRVRDELVVVELLLGAGLLVVVYAGALVIGLRASAPVEEVRRRQAEFTADASHELRTPLSVIQAEVGLALDRDRSAEYYRQTLHTVADESVRLRAIVDDLLWLARSDSGSEVPPPAVVDVSGLALAAVARFGAVARERGIDLRVEGAPSATVQAPAGWVDRLLGVLVDNACRYCAEGGEVLVRVEAAGGQVAVTVDDNGPGIPDDELPRILDRFHRASDVPGGTGLGLAIADSVVRVTGGTWHIGAAPSGGARFRVVWRAAAAGAAKTPVAVG